MDLNKLKSDVQEKINSNNVDIEKLEQNKVIIRLQELKDDNQARYTELRFLERLERIPNIDAMMEKMEKSEKEPKAADEKPPPEIYDEVTFKGY